MSAVRLGPRPTVLFLAATLGAGPAAAGIEFLDPESLLSVSQVPRIEYGRPGLVPDLPTGGVPDLSGPADRPAPIPYLGLRALSPLSYAPPPPPSLPPARSEAKNALARAHGFSSNLYRPLRKDEALPWYGSSYYGYYGSYGTSSLGRPW